MHRRRYNRYWSSTKIREAMHEFRNRGMDFLVQKYGNDRVRQIMSRLEGMNRRTPGRSGGGGYKVNIPGLGIRKIGNSKKNAPPKPLKKDSLTPGPRVGFRDGGPHDVPPISGNLPNGNAFPPGTFKPRMKMNLDNDEELAQGSQHPWAQPSSISSTITGLLRQAQNATGNYWTQWAQNKGGQYAIDDRGSGPMGTDMRWIPDANTTASGLASSNPLGAFGTNTIMSGGQAGAEAAHVGGHFQPNWDNIFKSIRDNPNDWPDWDTSTNPPTYRGPNWRQNQPRPNQPPTTTPPGTPPTTTPPAPAPKPIELAPTPPGYNLKNPSLPSPDDIFGAKPKPEDHEYNPWHRLEGGYNNRYGPSQQYMGQATMEALSLANAYFAPQRMELAYELGDMETDMRRLAVNLGRQTDDPVLQAKLYKEAMRATRTLDVQQNTFAFQMSEQRRREELQNFQFYDQLAQEEAKLKLQNRQFYDELEIRRRYFNLDATRVENDLRLRQQDLTAPPINSNPTPNTTTTGGGKQLGAQIVSNQFAVPGGGASLSGIYGNLLKRNPYTGRP